MLDLYAEFKAVTQAFNARGIEYAVCGGLAFAIHVRPRATLDMDFLVPATELARCIETLRSLGYAPHPRPMRFHGGAVCIQRLWKPQTGGGDVLMVDLLLVESQAIPGVWDGRERLFWEDVPVSVVSRDGLVALKRLRGSAQDAADIEGLTADGGDR